MCQIDLGLKSAVGVVNRCAICFILHTRPPDVLSRVEQLEEELGQTKRELRKAKEDLKTVMKSEKRLELTVRELMSEVLHIRRKQLQLDLSGHDDRLRKQVCFVGSYATCSVLPGFAEDSGTFCSLACAYAPFFCPSMGFQI